jgi:sugar phosphate isomerase/epimerase
MKKLEKTMNNQLTVFTKPWSQKPLPELAQFVKELEFDGVELPVRPGFQVTPETVRTGLPEAAKIFADYGVKIGSVAGSADEAMIAACGEAGVPILRIMAKIDMNLGYHATEKKFRKEYDALLPLLAQYDVKLGVQNHAGNFIGSAIGLMHLIENYEPKYIGAVLDLAHCSFAGEPSPIAIDVAWSHLILVNLKNGYWQRTSAPEAEEAHWQGYWTTGRHGLTSWREGVNELKQRNYKGDICLTAEYSAPRQVEAELEKEAIVNRLITEDIAYIKSLL